VAANLVGLATSDLQRGDVLTKPGWLVPTTQLSVELRLLAYLRRPLPHNATVSFHTGAAETMAKVRLLEKERLEPGETGWAQLRLDRPVGLVKGDHFIIRSPMETLGGGKIVDSHARRLRRFRPAAIESLAVKEKGTPEDVILALLEARQPLDIPALLKEADLPESEVRAAVESLVQQKKVIGVGQAENRLLFTAGGWERLTRDTTSILQDYHRKFPARPGMPRVELASRQKLSKQSAVMERLVADGVMNEEGLAVRLPSHRVQLTPAQQAKIDAFLKALALNPYSPPTDQLPEPDLLNLLIERRQVVKVSESVVFAAAAYDKMVERVLAHIKANGKITLAEVRDLFQTSRKYAQALIEYLDEKKITRRVGDERVLY
jgi:selenocysteine-specific elongation factor